MLARYYADIVRGAAIVSDVFFWTEQVTNWIEAGNVP